MLKTCNFFTNKLFQKGSIRNFDQVFSYLLQFLRTLKTHLHIEHTSWLLMKSEKRQTSNINNKKIIVKRLCFQYVFVQYHVLNVYLIRVVGAVENL